MAENPGEHAADGKRSVIVTGAGSGIGRAIAIAFAARGDAVTLVGRTQARLAETAVMIEQAGGTGWPRPTDMQDAADVAAMVADVVARTGGVQVLVNNAGQAVLSPVSDLDLGAFDRMLAVNTAGVVYACKAVWASLKHSGGGTIINISSMAAADPFPGLAVYGATKAFVNLLSKGLAEEGRADGIAVFAVGPGAVETDMLRGAFPDFPAEQALPPEAIAQVCLQLAEPAMQPCSGQTFYARK